jgi:hypothetical protein
MKHRNDICAKGVFQSLWSEVLHFLDRFSHKSRIVHQNINSAEAIDGLLHH